MLDKVAQTKYMADKISHRVMPKPHVDMSDTKQATDHVHDWVISEYHPCGSLAMGDAVDTKLRVKGVKGLRVVDASIFPNHVSKDSCRQTMLDANICRFRATSSVRYTPWERRVQISSRRIGTMEPSGGRLEGDQPNMAFILGFLCRRSRQLMNDESFASRARRELCNLGSPRYEAFIFLDSSFVVRWDRRLLLHQYSGHIFFGGGTTDPCWPE